MIFAARSLHVRQVVGLVVVTLALAFTLGAVGYWMGHRACAAPINVVQAHDTTKKAEAAQHAQDRPTLAADSALVRALTAKNTHLAATLDAALDALARIAVQQKGGFVHTDTDSVHKTGIMSTDSTVPIDPVAAVDTVRAALARCDTLASACEAYHVNASKKFALDSAVVRALHVEIDAYKAHQPSRWHQIGVAARGGVIGLVIGIAAARR